MVSQAVISLVAQSGWQPAGHVVSTMTAQITGTPESGNNQAANVASSQLVPTNDQEACRRARQIYAGQEHADMGPTNDVWKRTQDAGVNAPLSTARTTFYVRDIESSNQRRKRLFNRLWTLQNDRRHTYEPESTAKTAVRDDATWKRCDTILQQCEVPDWVKDWVLPTVLRQNLNGFSRYYAGADGACVGFALLAFCDTPGDAKDTWIAERAQKVVPGLDKEDVQSLIDYVFRKHDGDLP